MLSAACQVMSPTVKESSTARAWGLLETQRIRAIRGTHFTMFKKVHLRLTLLCAGITAVIMLVMSLCYLYVSEKGLYRNQFQAFQKRVPFMPSLTVTVAFCSDSLFRLSRLSRRSHVRGRCLP